MCVASDDAPLAAAVRAARSSTTAAIGSRPQPWPWSKSGDSSLATISRSSCPRIDGPAVVLPGCACELGSAAGAAFQQLLTTPCSQPAQTSNRKQQQRSDSRPCLHTQSGAPLILMLFTAMERFIG